KCGGCRWTTSSTRSSSGGCRTRRPRWADSPRTRPEPAGGRASPPPTRPGRAAPPRSVRPGRESRADVKLDRVVDAYLRHITVERGLSEHTVGAYRRDLAGYVAWLAERQVDETDAVTPALVAEFAAERASAQPAPAASSLARLQ